MKNKLFTISLTIVILASITLACSLFTGGADNSTSEPQPIGNSSDETTPEDPQEEETVQELPASPPDIADEVRPPDGIELGIEVSSTEGGYAYRVIPGYAHESVFGMTSMEAQDAVDDYGPFLMMFGGKNDEEMTNDDLYNQLIEESELNTSEDVEIVNQRAILVDGQTGTLLDVAGVEDGQKIRGRIVVVAVSPLQQFMMFSSSPAERWNEIAPLFDAVLASVYFFEPEGEGVLGWDKIIEDEGKLDIDEETDTDSEENMFMITQGESFPIIVENYIIQDQSTDSEFIVAFVSQDLNHTVTLYLPLDLNQSFIMMQPYEVNASTFAPSASITIGVDFYITQSGTVIIETITDDTVSGMYTIEAVNQADPTDIISVTGFFTNLPLP